MMRFSIEGTNSSFFTLDSVPPFYGGFGDGVFVTPEGDVVSLATVAIVRSLAIVS
jgi:hypothetical protein